MQNQAHFSNILVIPLIYKPRVNNNSKYARLFTLLHFQLIIQSPFTRTKRYTLFAQTWPGPISLSLPFLHFPPDQSTAQVYTRKGDPFWDPTERLWPKIRASKITGWSERSPTSSTTSTTPICRLYDRIRPIEKVERPNLDAAIRIVITKVQVGWGSIYICGGEIPQSSWKCNKEQGIASRVGSGELEASLYVRSPERSLLVVSCRWILGWRACIRNIGI